MSCRRGCTASATSASSPTAAAPRCSGARARRWAPSAAPPQAKPPTGLKRTMSRIATGARSPLRPWCYGGDAETRRRRGAGRPAVRFPADIERRVEVIQPASRLCPCGCGEMTRIGEDRSERLDIVPAQFVVIETVRPRYACNRCKGGGVVQAPAPASPIEGGQPTEGLVAHLPIAKYGRICAASVALLRNRCAELDEPPGPLCAGGGGAGAGRRARRHPAAEGGLRRRPRPRTDNERRSRGGGRAGQKPHGWSRRRFCRRIPCRWRSESGSPPAG